MKLPLTRLDRVPTFVERVRRSATGSGRCGSSSRARATTACSTFLRARCRPELARRVGLPRTSPGTTSDGVVRVGDFDAEPFRYIRLREPPYSDDDLRAVAERLRPPAYVYFRHEDEPTAPDYARRLAQITR